MRKYTLTYRGVHTSYVTLNEAQHTLQVLVDGETRGMHLRQQLLEHAEIYGHLPDVNREAFEEAVTVLLAPTLPTFRNKPSGSEDHYAYFSLDMHDSVKERLRDYEEAIETLHEAALRYYALERSIEADKDEAGKPPLGGWTVAQLIEAQNVHWPDSYFLLKEHIDDMANNDPYKAHVRLAHSYHPKALFYITEEGHTGARYGILDHEYCSFTFPSYTTAKGQQND